MNTNPGFLTPEEYASIYARVPIPCIDLIVICKGRFLLGLRNNEPEKGTWFLPGGRVFKNEMLMDAAVRKAKEELGIDVAVNSFKLLTVLDYTAKKGPFSEDSLHCINTIFTLNLAEEPDLTSDKQHSNLQWFTKIDPVWHLYVKEALYLARFK